MSINDASSKELDRFNEKAIEEAEIYAKNLARDSSKALAKPDNVNHPAHYNYGEIECIDYLEDNLGSGFDAYLEGNVKKYMHRFRHKGSEITDLRKARWYLDRLIATIVKADY
tara:strand:+ start:660 stop:998 length:339 start_codon:yes stop_codon:yes gene_type:complete